MRPRQHKQMTLKQKNTIIDIMVDLLRNKCFSYWICSMFADYFNSPHLTDRKIMTIFPELMTTINNVRNKQDKKEYKKSGRCWQRNAIHYKVGLRHSNRIRLLLNVKRRINK